MGEPEATVQEILPSAPGEAPMPADLSQRRRSPPVAITHVFGASAISWDEGAFAAPWCSGERWIPNLGYAEIDGIWYEVVGATRGHALLMSFGSLTCWEGGDGKTYCGYSVPDLRQKVGRTVTFYY